MWHQNGGVQWRDYSDPAKKLLDWIRQSSSRLNDRNVPKNVAEIQVPQYLIMILMLTFDYTLFLVNYERQV